MTFEYRLAVTNTKLKGHWFYLIKEWVCFEKILAEMNDPMSYDKMTFRIERRLKK